MWGDMVKVALGVLTVLAGTNLFVGAQTRQRRVLREEAELLEHLPRELPGRARFEEYLTEGLEVYIEQARGSSLTKLTRRFIAATIVAGAGALMLLGISWGRLAGIDLPMNLEDGWFGWFVGLGLAYGGLGWMSALLQRRRRLRHEEEARELETERATGDKIADARSEMVTTPRPG